MTYSLGLTLYNLSGRPSGSGVAPAWPDRQPGRLVWLNASGDEGLIVLQALARHLQDEGAVQVVLTTASEPPDPAIFPAPADHPAAIQAFLDHWRPEAVIFEGGELRPAAVYECNLRKLPLLMVNARAPRLSVGREGWYPGLFKSTLLVFRHILAQDDTAARALRKAGAEPGQIQVTGRMEGASAALPCVESDRAALAGLMATRPIWLAADVTAEELPHVIAAHRKALQLAHRLLLILVPQESANPKDLAEKLEADENWHVALRRAEQEPESEVSVYITDASEYGLWYRLAPVTFLGGSLEGAGCTRDPMEPAALGSAILYGPRSGAFGQACGRLGAARAARMVASGTDLAEALGDLLSPDRAARQAAAAWGVASEGAEASDRAMNLILDIMDGTL